MADEKEQHSRVLFTVTSVKISLTSSKQSMDRVAINHKLTIEMEEDREIPRKRGRRERKPLRESEIKLKGDQRGNQRGDPSLGWSVEVNKRSEKEKGL